MTAAPAPRLVPASVQPRPGRGRVFDSITDTIGDTPLVRLNRLPQIKGIKATMLAKLEFFNPLGSVKDRIGVAMIDALEADGRLTQDTVLIEPTSGNTGIALAMVCAAKGYPFVAVMSDSFSVERRKLMKGLGAKVILTPAAERGSGMVKRAEELAKKHGFFLPQQFENPANPEYHRNTTGPEILRDFANRRLDYWVTGWGTGGTLTGAGQVIKAARPEVKIIATEPEVASLLGGKEWKPHKIQGWTPDFLPDVLDPSVHDRLIPVSEEDSRSWARRLAAEEGIFVGISAGATLAAAMQVARDAAPGTSLLVMLPDTGDRYLSSWLFEDLEAGSDDAWLASL